MNLSIVTTLYRSEEYIAEFHERASTAAKSLTEDYEIIFVDDGCPGRSLELALEVVASDKHTRLIELSRNFGHHLAAYAALEAASGKQIFLIDADLEESPEWLIQFHEIMRNTGADLVYGVQRRRQRNIRQGLSSLFYRLFNALSETRIPQDVCTVRLMTRDYRNALLEMREKNVFLAGLFAWVGFHQVAVPVEKKPREDAKSTYGVVRLLRLLVNAITSFSPFPLYAAFYLGVAISASAGIYGTYLIIRKLLIPGSLVSGYVSQITAVFFVGGLTIFFMGVIGIYLSKMFLEVKDRPRYLIKNAYGFGNPGDRDPE
jgi:putative glycosyltransferase